MTLEINNVTKRYNGKPALDRVNLRFEGPRIYGLLGRNGAGKTTLMNMISGRIFPTEGEILLDGEPIAENDDTLGKIFSMSETNYFPEKMKVCEVFSTLTTLYPQFDRDYADELCGKFELNEFKENNKLSTGFGTILKLVAGMASRAPILLLDEPVLGLDANNRDLFYRELLKDYEKNPRLIIFSTHIIEEVSKLIEKAVILRSGRVILDEEIDSLLAGAYSVSGPAGEIDSYVSGKDILGEDTLGGLKTVYLRGEPTGQLPMGLELGKMSLQKLFIELTNR